MAGASRREPAVHEELTSPIPLRLSCSRRSASLDQSIAKLADVLANAATGSPDEVPSLLDLVQARSKLPSWMTAPVDIDATTKTREVVLAERPTEREPVRWVSWQEKSRGGASMPTTPGSPFLQSVFSTPTPAPIPLIRSGRHNHQHGHLFERVFAEVLSAVVLGQLHCAAGTWVRLRNRLACCTVLHGDWLSCVWCC